MKEETKSKLQAAGDWMMDFWLGHIGFRWFVTGAVVGLLVAWLV